MSMPVAARLCHRGFLVAFAAGIALAAMARLDGRKVLVHCQVNMRASSMVFEPY